MNTRKRPPRPLLLIFAASMAQTGVAQTVTYLAPAKTEINLGEAVTVHVDQGTGDKAVQADWPADDIRWMLVRSGPTQQNLDTIKPTRAGEQTVEITPEYAGVTLVAMDLERPVKLEPVESLRAFGTRHLADELPETLERLADTATVRVRRLESTKTLICVED
ncbi:MAG: hypothetical protein JXO22_03315, partial [Phycisphaerae bacterium]|nr:hypothetical protein [Phycisphaerae bacterium]